MLEEREPTGVKSGLEGRDGLNEAHSPKRAREGSSNPGSKSVGLHQEAGRWERDSGKRNKRQKCPKVLRNSDTERAVKVPKLVCTLCLFGLCSIVS